MLDIQFIRDNVEKVKTNSKAKGYDVDIERLIEVDKYRKEDLALVEDLRKNINEATEEFQNKPPNEAQRNTVREIKARLKDAEIKLEEYNDEFFQLLKSVPNMSLPEVPIGKTEDDNVVVYEKGEKRKFDFEPKNHAEIAEARGWLDKERAAKVAGSPFAYIKGDLFKLQFALINWITDILTDEKSLGAIADGAGLEGVSAKPFVPVLPPLMLKTEVYDAMDRLEPRDDRYKIEGEELWLQGSAEHVLGSMHANETLPASDLPLRYLGFATSFRREAGTYGKDMEGIIRMHQFDKLEMESLTHPNEGPAEHNFLIAIQEYILQQLKLPYRKLQKSTFDIGKPNASGVDMEVWLPAQNRYRETHTADYMTDYQARRLKTKVKAAETKEDAAKESTVLVHTNDATALATGRGMVAIIENYQTEDMHVQIPEVLKKYMGDKEKI